MGLGPVVVGGCCWDGIGAGCCWSWEWSCGGGELMVSGSDVM